MNLAPQAIPIFSPDGEKRELRDYSKPGNEIEENKDKRPALTIGRNIQIFFKSLLLFYLQASSHWSK